MLMFLFFSLKPNWGFSLREKYCLYRVYNIPFKFNKTVKIFLVFMSLKLFLALVFDLFICFLGWRESIVPRFPIHCVEHKWGEKGM